MTESEELRAGDSVTLTIEAEVTATYPGTGRVRVMWHSGEETIHPSDQRLSI